MKSNLSKRQLILIGVVVVALLAVGVVAVIGMGLLTAKPQATLAVDTRNPVAATDKLNHYAVEAAQALPTGSMDKSAAALNLLRIGFPVQNGLLTSMEFSLDADMNLSDSGNLKANFNGIMRTVDNKVSTKLDGTISTKDVSSIPISFVSVDDKSYVKLGTIPSSLINTILSSQDLGSAATQIAQLFTKLENQWLKLDSSQVASVSDKASAQISESDKQQLVEQLKSNPLFVNPKASADRTFAGEKLGCMQMEINPAVSNDSNNFKELSAVELCTKGEGQLPILIVANIGKTGEKNTGTVQFGILSYNKDLPITAPTGAKTIEEILLSGSLF
jgi:hypothetical protein